MDGTIRMRLGMAADRSFAPAAALDREAAFRRLVDERLDASYRLAALLLGDRMEAEDATHDAVVRAWRSFDTHRDGRRFESWFQRIVVNACRDRLRQRSSRPVGQLLPDLSGPSRSDPGAAVPEQEALRTALSTLAGDKRLVIVLRFYADLTIDEIADRLGQRPGTVKSRLHHALKELRAAYEAGARSPRGDTA
jgi:RNA polymerase sigma-70 factor (ECF subfamily)